MVEFTGERLVPGQVGQDLFNEHISRYAFVSQLARNKRVLDIACGMGYGSSALAATAASVVGLDMSQEAVSAARALYREQNLQFLVAPAQQIPFSNGSFDLIVAFEVIEHLSDWRALLSEARRLLSPDGRFVVSTPNLNYYAETRKIAGPNPYHLHEFTYEEFRAELTAVFPSVEVLLQNHVEAISFHSVSGAPHLAAERAGDRATAAPDDSHFFVAVCSLGHQGSVPDYLYLPSATNVLREREQHIAKLERELDQKDRWLEELKLQHFELHGLHQIQTQWALGLEKDLTAAATTVELYERKVAELEAELTAKVEELGVCVDILHKTEAIVEERTIWAQRLDQTVQQLQATLGAASASRWIGLGRMFGVGPDLSKR